MNDTSAHTFLRPTEMTATRHGAVMAPTAGHIAPELKAWENRLGIFDRMRLSALTRREISHYLGEVFINRMKAAKEVQLNRDALWVEEQNEIEYLASQERMHQVEKEMTITATEFVDALVDACFEFNKRFWEKKTERSAQLAQAKTEGRLAQQDYERGMALIEELADAQCQDVKERVNAVLTKLRERFDRALVLFKGHPG